MTQIEKFYEDRSKWDLFDARINGNIFEKIIHTKRVNAVIENCTIQNKKILDAGCGCGLFAADMVKNHGYIIGLDISRWALMRCASHVSENGKEIILVQGHLQNVPFKECTFDVIIFAGVIEHLHNQKETLAELFKLLKRDGIIFVSGPYKNNIVWRFKALRKFLSSYKLHEEEPFHDSYSLEELENLVSSAGFAIHKRFYSAIYSEVNIIGKKI